MEIIYRRSRATAAEVRQDLPDPPGYSAVRSALRLLEQKGVLRHQRDGQRYLFEPTAPKKQARGSALQQLVRTFFEGSRQQAISALIDDQDFRLSEAEHERLAALLDEARRRGES